MLISKVSTIMGGSYLVNKMPVILTCAVHRGHAKTHDFVVRGQIMRVHANNRYKLGYNSYCICIILIKLYIFINKCLLFN